MVSKISYLSLSYNIFNLVESIKLNINFKIYLLFYYPRSCVKYTHLIHYYTYTSNIIYINHLFIYT